MKLENQYIVLGFLQTKHMEFRRRTLELYNLNKKAPAKIMHISNKYVYRFYLGYGQRIDMLADEVLYLLHFGIYNPSAKVIHKDGDIHNNHKDNLTLNIEGREIANDIRQKIHQMFAAGQGYAEIGRLLNVNRQTVKEICKVHFNNPHPRQFLREKKLTDSFKPPKFDKR